jgi:iron complex outermembrane recepter protein
MARSLATTEPNWQNADAKTIWRPFGVDDSQEISYGIDGDRYYFDNSVYASSTWNAASTSTGQLNRIVDFRA